MSALKLYDKISKRLQTKPLLEEYIIFLQQPEHSNYVSVILTSTSKQASLSSTNRCHVMHRGFCRIVYKVTKLSLMSSHIRTNWRSDLCNPVR